MLRNAALRWLIPIFVLAAAPAHAGWRGFALTLPQEPPIKLLTAQGHLLVLHARQLTVVNTAGQIRRAYALNSQTDALTDITTHGATWFLASRRTLLSSEDGGYSWRALDSLTPRDPNEWLAVIGLGALSLGASKYGLKRVEPGLSTAWGPAGHDPIDRAVSRPGVLAWETVDGLFAVTAATDLQRVRMPLPFGLSAVLQEGPALWLAGSRGVTQCLEACGMFSGPADTRDLVRFAGAHWAAAPDGVWRLPANDGGAWQSAGAGLGAAVPYSFTVWKDSLWLLTDTGLYQWEEMPAPASGAVGHPLLHPLRGPAMDEVRRMVFAAQTFVAGDAESWRKRVRWRAAAPTLGFTVRQGADERSGQSVGNTVGLSTTEARIVIGPDGESNSRSSGRSTDYGLALTWRLDDLVFNTDELSVNGEAEEVFKLRKTIMLDVTRLYYDRLRVLAERERSVEQAKQIELEIRFDELTADLDFYTGGRFSKALRPSAERP